MNLRHNTSTLFAATAFGLVLYSCDAIVCYIGQQPDPGNDNEMRWVLPYTRNVRCSCTKILFGGLNMKPMDGWNDPLYTDEPLKFVNNDNLETLRELLGCNEKTERSTAENTKQSSSTTQVNQDSVTKQQTSTHQKDENTKQPSSASEVIKKEEESVTQQQTSTDHADEYDAITCDTDWKAFGGNYYFFADTASETFSGAQTACQNMHAKLASIHSQDEADFIGLHTKNDDWWSYWIGFTDQVTENTFVWTDGTTTDYINWQSEQPDNWKEQDCVVVVPKKNNNWNDKDCDYDYANGYVCKKTG